MIDLLNAELELCKAECAIVLAELKHLTAQATVRNKPTLAPPVGRAIERLREAGERLRPYRIKGF